MHTTYLNKRTNEQVKPWAWAWRAVYRLPEDVVGKAVAARGKVTPVCQYQFDEATGLMHNFDVIDQEKLRFFEVYRHGTDLPPVRIVMQEGMRLLFLNRKLTVGYLGNKVFDIYVVGYKQGNAHAYLYLLPDGTTYLSSEDNIDLPELFLYA